MKDIDPELQEFLGKDSVSQPVNNNPRRFPARSMSRNPLLMAVGNPVPCCTNPHEPGHVCENPRHRNPWLAKGHKYPPAREVKVFKTARAADDYAYAQRVAGYPPPFIHSISNREYKQRVNRNPLTHHEREIMQKRQEDFADRYWAHGGPTVRDDPSPFYWRGRRDEARTIGESQNIEELDYPEFQTVRNPRNPMTRLETGKLLREADRMAARADAARADSDAIGESRYDGTAVGMRYAARKYGRNPGIAEAPFNPGKKITLREFEGWLAKNGSSEEQREYARTKAAYRKFHLGADPKYVTREVMDVGTNRQISERGFGYSMGKSTHETYQTPSYSQKAGTVYVHKWDTQPEAIVTSSGKIIMKPLKGSARVNDWLRG